MQRGSRPWSARVSLCSTRVRSSLTPRSIFPPLHVLTEVVAAPTISGLTATNKKAVALAKIIAPRTAIAYLKLWSPLLRCRLGNISKTGARYVAQKLRMP